MGSRRIPITLSLLALTLFSAVLPTRVTTSTALDWDQSFYALTCDVDPGPIPLRDTHFPPEDCSPIPYATLVLTSLEGYLVDSCRTDQDGWCRMSGKQYLSYQVELVAGDIPEGQVARDNPTLYRRESSIGTGVVFIPADEIASDADGAQVTIHSRYCPTDYQGDDLFNDCHGTAPPFHQVLQAFGPTVRSVQTDEEGNATFGPLTPSDWLIWTYLRDGDTLRDAFCSYAATPGVRSDNYVINLEPGTAGAIRLSMQLQAGDSLLCDIYVTPHEVPRDDVLLTVRLRTCDDLFSPTQIYDECFANGRGGLFELSGPVGFYLMGRLDDEGNATLLVPPGRYIAINGPGHNVAGVYTSCTEGGDPDTHTESMPEMEAGEAWTCDIFVTFESFR